MVTGEVMRDVTADVTVTLPDAEADTDTEAAIPLPPDFHVTNKQRTPDKCKLSACRECRSWLQQPHESA